MPKPPKTYQAGGQVWTIKTDYLKGGRARSREDGPAEIRRNGRDVWQHVWFAGDQEIPTRENGPWLTRTNGDAHFVSEMEKILGIPIEEFKLNA